MKACTCGTDCGFHRGDLVCQYCEVPYEYAQYPIDMSQTLMSHHNRIKMVCGLCVHWFREQHRKKVAAPIPPPPWSSEVRKIVSCG